jgi:hypothetical protein
MSTPASNIAPQEGFSGSYSPADCTFLLKVLGQASKTQFQDISAKEGDIQRGVRHYCEMISQERAPSASYMAIFDWAVQQHGARLAQHVKQLAEEIIQRRGHQVTLVSLARAGTPIGVLLQRQLKRQGVDSAHYSISIVRDRGIDQNALRYLFEVANRDPTSVVFVDGWTAKGAITRELKQSVAAWNKLYPFWAISNELFVISDVGGIADVCATQSDYLIPSGILNSVVSGLVSRSILNDQIRPTDFHGCIYYDTLIEQDRSLWFVDQITALQVTEHKIPESSIPLTEPMRFHTIASMLWDLMRAHKVSDVNRIKPGIAEATRAMLRRIPDLLILADLGDPDVSHLILLAKEKQVPVEVNPALVFRAVTLIRDVT